MSDYYKQALERAIRSLDTHWVLHPQNRLRKRRHPLPDAVRWTPPKVLAKARSTKTRHK